MIRTPGPVEVRRADALRPGDQFWSPANRWETVTTMTKHIDSATALLVTDKTARPWPLASYREVQVIPRDSVQSVAVAVEDTGRMGIKVVVMAANAMSSAWEPDHAVLAEGNHLGTTHGWAVWDHSGDDGLPVRTPCPTKAAARSALVRVAKAYAKAMKLPYRGVLGGAS